MRRAAGLFMLTAFTLLAAGFPSCQQPKPSQKRSGSTQSAINEFAVALGNLRGNRQPTETESKLAEFFFGTEPEPALGLLKPTSIAFASSVLYVCDPSQSSVFRFDAERESMEPVDFHVQLRRPNSISNSEDGGFLVCDVGLGAVVLFDGTGAQQRRFTLPNEEFRPADAVRVADKVWVANTALHRIEVFHYESGSHERSIGSRGEGPAEFGFPLGMCRGPDGRVYVADSLNHRVQVFDDSGAAVGVVGRPGDRIGSFGKPKDVAVAPDGTVFVVDASSQRVHAFDRRGKPITAFGEPRGRAGELSMPTGVAVSPTYPGGGGPALPEGFVPDCYVLVAEQLRQPGVRVFAWRGPREDGRPTFPPRSAHDFRPASLVENPHWASDRCDACHQIHEGRPTPIEAEKIDAGCLRCHDGVNAQAEAHPTGRKGHGPFAEVPAEWPLNEGRLGCLTCHDILRHCDARAARPSRNPVMLRGAAVERPLDFCTNCHTPSEQWRINPHRQIAEDGSVRTETCGFCHSSEPARPADGRRSNNPPLRAAGSAICLSCHAVHWDYFPEGHVERPMTEEIRQRLIAREFAGSDSTPDSSVELSEAMGDPNRVPTLLPLVENRVTCYTCHTPHAPGLFPAASPLGMAAAEGEDARLQLRMTRLELCQTCHSK